MCFLEFLSLPDHFLCAPDSSLKNHAVAPYQKTDKASFQRRLRPDSAFITREKGGRVGVHVLRYTFSHRLPLSTSRVSGRRLFTTARDFLIVFHWPITFCVPKHSIDHLTRFKFLFKQEVFFS